MGAQVKLWNPSTSATPECFCSKVLLLSCAISRVWALPLPLFISNANPFPITSLGCNRNANPLEQFYLETSWFGAKLIWRRVNCRTNCNLCRTCTSYWHQWRTVWTCLLASLRTIWHRLFSRDSVMECSLCCSPVMSVVLCCRLVQHVRAAGASAGQSGRVCWRVWGPSDTNWSCCYTISTGGQCVYICQ